MPVLDRWDSFYVIVGSAAGALIGLQFVVMTLIAERPPPRPAEGGAAFSTPTIVHFSVALLLSALFRVPWDNIEESALSAGTVGFAGTAYALLTAWRMRKQTMYSPDMEDWSFHMLLPLTAYVLLAGTALCMAAHAREAMFAAGAATLILLFCGIHNAWDAVVWHVMMRRAEPDKDKSKPD
jgi:hypothetical protein